MSKLCLFLVSIFCMISMVSNASLYEYEGFDYAGTNVTGKNGGIGWGGAWDDPGNDLNLSDDNSSLNSWAFPYTPQGARVLDKNGGDATRVLGTSINMAQDGVTYLSALMRKDTTSGGVSEYVLIKLIDNSSNVRFQMGIGSTDKPIVGITTTASAAGSVSAGSSYFLVAKLVSKASGNDEVYLKVYDPYDDVDVTEPSSWTVATNAVTGVTLTKVFFQIGNNVTDGGMIDELRIGSSWSDVVPGEPEDLLEYEGFDYAGTTISNKSGGTGWGGVWDDSDNDLNLSDDGVSLSSSALLYTNVGARVFDTNGGEALRTLGVPLDMGRDLTSYIGVLMRKNTTSGGSSEYVEFNCIDYASVKRFLFGIGSDDKFYIGAGDTSSSKSSILAVAGETYYLVVKFVTSAAGNDEAFLKVYAPGSIMGEEPTGADWTVTNTGAVSSVLKRMQLQMGSNITAGGAIDEIRIGKTWLSVAKPAPLGTVVTIK